MYLYTNVFSINLDLYNRVLEEIDFPKAYESTMNCVGLVVAEVTGLCRQTVSCCCRRRRRLQSADLRVGSHH